MYNEATVSAVAELFKACGDPTRVRILSALMEKKELCVQDIAALLDMTSSAISHQLRILRQQHIIRARRDGKLIYYSLDDTHVEAIFATALEHVGHNGEGDEA